ncbi:hypothetical protein D3C71_344190 [compost metagenome]
MMNKLGRIEISDDFLNLKNAKILGALFSKFIPCHIDINARYRHIIYTGFSEQFEEVNEGFGIPLYVVEIYNKEGDFYEINFTKS